MKERLKYEDITKTIIGCAMKVHNKMGCGYREAIYARCLAIEFERAGLKFIQEWQQHVYYDEVIVGGRRVDFLVEGKVPVELKAMHEMTKVELTQAINFLEASKQEFGLLINFGAPSLQFRRVNNRKMHRLTVNPANPFNPKNPRL